MKVLIVAATAMELEGLHKFPAIPHLELHSLLTGIGMVATSYQLCKKLLEQKYDLAINIGLAGSFNRNIPIAEIVEVQKDRFSELGAEDDNSFLELHQMQLMSENEFPFQNNYIHASATMESNLRKVSGITVNKVHGNEESIERLRKRLNPDVESMEGAAFMYVCKMEKIPCIQLRAISNYVEKRNRHNWEIKKAMDQLNKELENYLMML